MQLDGQPAISYGWNDVNRILTISQAPGPLNGNSSQSVLYNWDAANRLVGRQLPNQISENRSVNQSGDTTQITFVSPSAQVGSVTYTYDAAHRTVSQNSTFASPLLPSAAIFQYNSAGRLVVANNSAITYDDNGSVIADGSYVYRWDARGSLSQLQMPSGQQVASFGYDPFGRRSSVMLSVDTAPRSVVFDGQNAVQEWMSIQGQQVGGNLIASYLTGLSVDETIGRYTPQSTDYLLVDALNSTLALTNSAATITTEYSYDPYGNTQTTGNASQNNRQYTGRENDQTGLYYNRARYLNTSLGRFVSEDPIGWVSGQSSRYGYVNGNPISYSDPYGLAGGMGGGYSSGAEGLKSGADGLDPDPINAGDPLPPIPGKLPIPTCHQECPPPNMCPVNPPKGLPGLGGCTLVCTTGPAAVPGQASPVPGSTPAGHILY